MVLQWYCCKNSLLETLILSAQVKTIFRRKLESKNTFSAFSHFQPFYIIISDILNQL